MSHRSEEELGTHGGSSITAYLTADHRRLEVSLDEAEALVDCGGLGEAGASFARFADGLRRHIALEENVVFPIFEERARIVGPLQVMEREHRQIERLLTTAGQALEVRDAAAFAREARALRSLLDAHNRKEERILYPRTDASLSPLERATLATRLERS
jgi:iron-sulfur cluster repair protein YtfE (RIC family)